MKLKEEIKKIVMDVFIDGVKQGQDPLPVTALKQSYSDEILALFAKFGEELIGEDELQVFDENESEYGTNDAKLDGRNELRAEMRNRLKEMIGEK